MLRPWFIIGVLIFLAVAKTVHSNRCLTSLEEVNPKRMVHVDGQSLNIQFDLSQRVTQRLVSKIMKIFLKEVLGYSGVTAVEKDDAFDVHAVFERLSEQVTHAGYKKLPETMVNMEVWVPPGLDTMYLVNKYDVKEVGSVALPGHFGWFVPEALSRIEDNWMTFARRESAARFDVDERILAVVKNFTIDPDTRQYHCQRSYCEYGMYIPDQCRGTRGYKAEPCALLLAADPDVTGFAKDHIDKLKLYVKIAWVGPQLKRLTDSLIDQYTAHLDNSTGGQADQRSVVILHWTPSDVIPSDVNFTTIEFPHCGSRGLEIGCAYESNRLVKMVWAQLEVLAKFAYEAISRSYFTADMYEDLISRYTRFSGSATENEIACAWLKENLNYTLDNWMPNSADKNTLYVGGIFPMSGTFYTARSIIVAAKMAKNAINQNNTVLRDYNLTLLASDGQCKSDMVMKSFIDYIAHNYFEKLVGVLGPACSETVEPLVGVSRHYQTVVISYSAEGSSFNDRTRYPYFFRTIGENKQYNLVYLQLLQRLGWRRVASLAEDGQKYTEYISYMQDTLRDNGISFVANVKFPREREAYSMTKYLEDLKQKRAKIIIADVYDPIARQVMCEAFKLKMTAVEGYVWFLPLWLRPRWYDTDYYNKSGEQVACTTAEMQKAINGHLGLSHAYYAPDGELMQENVTVREWRERYENLCRERNLVPSNYAGFAYDAMWTYALAVDRLLRENQSYVFELHSEQTVNRLTDIIAETDFFGVSGRIRFINGPSRYSVITVVQRVDDEIRQIGNYYPNITGPRHEVTSGRLDLNVSEIVWLSKSKPDDGSEAPPTCVLSGLANLLDVSCEVAIVVVNLISFSLVGALLVVGFFIIKRKYEEKLRQHEKYMKSFGIDPSFTTDTASLDKWEIPRDRVVINRKIGEGAFGTVYGGEAFFPEKGWLAVAVKTLKVGSTTEEKLDFLSEVEVMKRFDHKNIIKLLAVCIKGEPVLTVMEFMLYGDLKTYLLARRHLVNDRSYEDSDEISNKRLTCMALDVARALSYLAQLKYVHRDVASRNCLVNAQRVVKLGDFGMTRPMYENDYYKFNRKGMLPVRWMAPESLGLGIFTPASDVWSYGVLLYEIVTFGSFPFQGMSNNQVLTHVKAGNSLVVPKGVKSQLENLMYACWTVEHSKRPTAPEIVDFLASNLRILAPCLDVPLASVQLEHSGQIEMLDLPENLRKFSVPMGWPLNQQSKPSSDDSPDSPLLDISCQEQTQNTSNGLSGAAGGGQVLERNNLAPLFPPPGASVFADFAKKKEKTHKYVNLQPGQFDKSEENGDVNIPMEERKTSKFLMTDKDSPASVSIF